MRRLARSVPYSLPPPDSRPKRLYFPQRPIYSDGFFRRRFYLFIFLNYLPSSLGVVEAAASVISSLRHYRKKRIFYSIVFDQSQSMKSF